jgi:SPP1 gp7 family putative phage head morphogenesis protein
MNVRFARLKIDIRKSIIDQDCFGIQPSNEVTALQATSRRQFAFPRSAQKVDAFMAWLEEQERQGILDIIYRPGSIRGLEQAWTDVYIHSAYARGIMRGRTELSRAGYDVTPMGQIGGGISALMNQPFHADRVGLLYTRTFEDLKSVTRIMNSAIRRTISDGLTIGLSRGMAEGKNPRQIARELYKDVQHHVDKIGVTRARMIARTEIIRAHHLATVAEYRRADAEMGVRVQAEWLTAGDERVCEFCVELQGKIYTLNEIEGMIPAHPQCRCCAIPALAEREGERK